jgi:hypothetical protein
MRRSNRSRSNLPLKNFSLGNRLDLSLIRLARIKKRKMPQTMGETVDSYEAMLNELELQTSMLTSQSSIEVQKAEVLTNQLTSQINTSEAIVIAQLNQYSAEQVASVSTQVKNSNQSITMSPDSNVYDMSFISTMDYSKVNISNDSNVLESRVDNRENFRLELLDMKTEITFHQGLISKTRLDDPMLTDLYNARNYFVIKYYFACIKFYQEATVIGFLHNPTNNIANLNDYIKINEENLAPAKIALEGKRLSIGEEAYNKELSNLKYIESMLIMAKYRLKYISQAFAGKWTPPTFESLLKIAEDQNMTLSRVVFDMSEMTRQTLCIPDWVLGIAEMYNQIEVFNQGANVVPLNPYDAVWIRKAKEIINMEAEGVVSTASKLFTVIDKYWEVLTGSFTKMENMHIDAVLDKASREDNNPNYTYIYPYSDDGVDLIYFDEEQIKLEALIDTSTIL